MPTILKQNNFVPVAVIGAGHIAHQHIGALSEVVGPKNVSVCDLSPILAEAMADRYNLSGWYTDFEKQLLTEKPKVAHITTPAPSHYPIAKKCLEMGVNVFLEKPATESLPQLEELLALAESKNLYLIEDQNYPFNAETQELIQRMNQGELGDIVHVEVMLNLNILGKGSRYVDPTTPHPSVNEPGGAVSDFLTHLVSLAYPFVGAHRSVKTVWRKDSDAPLPYDEFRCITDAERGTASLIFSARTQPDGFWLRVYGTKAQCVCNMWEPKIVEHKTYDMPQALTQIVNAAQEAFQLALRGPASLSKKLSGGPGPYQGLWRLVEQSYVAFNSNNAMPITHTQVREVNQWVHAILNEVSSK